MSLWSKPRGSGASGARRASLALVVLTVGALVFAGLAGAQTAVDLGTAESFAVLAGAGVTNTGPTIVNGDLGTCPTPAITGFPPGIVNGTIHAADAVACQAQSDLTIAYNSAAGQAPDTVFAGPTDLGGQTLTPGVYRSPTSLAITGTLTLDAQGDPDAVFIFQAGSTLITAPNSRVVLVNGAQACNVFWQVGSSATLGVGSTFVGTIIALTSITANTNATVEGRLLARNGAVTLDSNTITRPVCAPTTTTSTSTSTTTIPTTTSTSTSTTTPTSTSTTVPPITITVPPITIPDPPITITVPPITIPPITIPPIITSTTTSTTLPTTTSTSTTLPTTTSTTTSTTSSSTSTTLAPITITVPPITITVPITIPVPPITITVPPITVPVPPVNVPPTGTVPATTTSTSTTTTVPATTTTTVPATTTTTVPATTTTTIATTVGGEAATTGDDEVAVAEGRRAAIASVGEVQLAFTGSPVRWIAFAGGLAVALGSLMVLIAGPERPTRRRQRARAGARFATRGHVRTRGEQLWPSFGGDLAQPIAGSMRIDIPSLRLWARRHDWAAHPRIRSRRNRHRTTSRAPP